MAFTVHLLLLLPMVSFSLETIMYGSLSGIYSQTIFDQGRITGITSCGYENTFHGLLIAGWTSDSKSNSDRNHRIGEAAIATSCTPFSLNANDYIDSYAVEFSENSFVRSISFHATNSNTYTCSIDPTYYASLTDIKMTQTVKISGTYLTGFKFHYGGIIDAIGFQFTDLNALITTTDMYGIGVGGSFVEMLNQGRINAISNWGYNALTFQAVGILEWSADSQTSTTALGLPADVSSPCTPFTLTAQQRIDGYRVTHGELVHSIGFLLSDGTMRFCLPPELPAVYVDTGWITIYPPSYLSGFWAKAGGVIDQILFQFTAVSVTCPSGSTQVGGIQSNNDIFGCGLDSESCSSRFDTTVIAECKDKCTANVNCTAFNFAPKGGDTLNADDIVCTLYGSIIPSRSFGYQIFCKLDTSSPTQSPTKFPTQNPTETLLCPDGSVQIGTVTTNNDILGCGLDSADCNARFDTSDIMQCRDKCLANMNCAAFNYAPLGGDPIARNDIVCTMYDSRAPDRTLGYQIFCDLVTSDPTSDPSTSPTTSNPTKSPTLNPTKTPTSNPTKYPTSNPTLNPTKYPTKYPTKSPTKYPTANPTKSPTAFPTTNPITKEPTLSPTEQPTSNPTKYPTSFPTTNEPTNKPTLEGQVDDESTTANDGNGKEEEEAINDASIGLSEREYIILYIILLIIALLLCCICVLGMIVRRRFHNKTKQSYKENVNEIGKQTFELQKVQSVSIFNNSKIMPAPHVSASPNVIIQYENEQEEDDALYVTNEGNSYNATPVTPLTKGNNEPVIAEDDNGESDLDINMDAADESDDDLYSNKDQQTTSRQ